MSSPSMLKDSRISQEEGVHITEGIETETTGSGKEKLARKIWKRLSKSEKARLLELFRICIWTNTKK